MSTLCIGDSHIRRFGDFVGLDRPASQIFEIAGLPPVYFFGVSGGSVTRQNQLESFKAAIDYYKPTNLIVFLGGNDLDSREDSTEVTIHKLIAYLTHLKQYANLNDITVLKFIPRRSTRSVAAEIYNNRVIEANRLLKDHCPRSGLHYWRSRGFTNSATNILSDGVHLNVVGQNKLFREIRGILLSQRQF